MKNITKDELIEILEQHELWIRTRHDDPRKGKCADLSQTNLRGADLRGAELGDADLTHADLTEAKLRGACLIMANLSNAELGDADFRESDLRGANLADANLGRADLREAKLDHIKNKAIFCFQGVPPRAIYVDGNVYIGCGGGALEYWERNYKEIGRREGYTEKQIEPYGLWLTEFLPKLIKLTETKEN